MKTGFFIRACMSSLLFPSRPCTYHLADGIIEAIDEPNG